MSEQYKIPKQSWYVPFGPIREVDLVRASALTAWREKSSATYSHGKQLVKLEACFESSRQVTSQINPPRDNCTYWLRGKLDSENADQPGLLFIVRDGAILSIKEVNRHDWEVMP
jgi:hypothetical protein